MDDILSSIKKFVAGEESNKPTRMQEAQPAQRDDDVVRLAPVCPADDAKVVPDRRDFEAKAQAAKDLAMPEFIRKAQLDRQEKEAISEQADDQREPLVEAVPQLDETTATAESAAPETVTDLMQSYLKTVQVLAKEKAEEVRPSPQRKSLDALVEATVQSATRSWLDQNLRTIVESVVRQEIEKLTHSILNPGGE